jgi:thymidylate synthase
MRPLHDQWLNQLCRLELQPERVIGPRGFATREVLNWSMEIDSNEALLDVKGRKLNYRFAVAEWVWMMFGRSDVESVAQFNSIMRQFSDDGVWLTGAYGPHICAQKQRVISKLRKDPATRQAVIQIPRPPLVDTKDEPCTLSLQYLFRDGKLHCTVTMRSSDIWLGVPYDMFTFSQVQNCIAGELGMPRGNLMLQAASSHLYERDIPAIQNCFDHSITSTLGMPDLPGFPPYWLEDVLVKRDSLCIPHNADHSWLPYAAVLLSTTSDAAYDILKASHNQRAQD